MKMSLHTSIASIANYYPIKMYYRKAPCNRIICLKKLGVKCSKMCVTLHKNTRVGTQSFRTQIKVKISEQVCYSGLLLQVKQFAMSNPGELNYPRHEHFVDRYDSCIYERNA